MSLERREEERRLTTEERDRVLDIAARLQAQHQSTVAVSDLTQAANEAGIEPRFVQEAIGRLDEKPAPDLTYLIPLALFVVQACSFMLQKDITVSGGDRPLILHEAMVAGVTWVFVGIAASFYMNQKFLEGSWVPRFAALYGLIQTVAALGGLLVSSLIRAQRKDSSSIRS